MYHLGETGFLIKITIMKDFLMGIHALILYMLDISEYYVLI